MTLVATWAGIRFVGLNPRDAHLFRSCGLFGFARRETDHDCTLLFLDHADDIAQTIGPSHPRWADAKALGFNELQLNLQAVRRIDRLQQCDRIIRRIQPLLNVVDGAEDRERQDALRLHVG